MRVPAVISYLCLACLATAAPAPAETTGSDAAFPLHVQADASFFCDNTEYHNEYGTGQTLMGAYTSLYLVYERPSFAFSLGCFLRRDFGEEQEVSEALPLFRFSCQRSHYRLLAGVIDSRNNHGLHEAMLVRQYGLIYPVEEGLQILARYKNLSADAWINWYLLNTPEHREFFAGGLYGKATWPLVSAEVGLRVSHHGGQLYEVGPVSDNLSGMVRWTISDTWSTLDAEFGFVGTLLGSLDVPDRDAADGSVKGFGADLEFFIAPKGWRIYYCLFSGHDFIVEQGNPLYRTEEAFHRFGLRKIMVIEDMVRARFQAEGLVIDSDLEYNYSLIIDVFLNLFHRSPDR